MSDVKNIKNLFFNLKNLFYPPFLFIPFFADYKSADKYERFPYNYEQITSKKEQKAPPNLKKQDTNH